MTCKSSVLFPIPGSPPTSDRDPGTTPPPRTRFSSPTPVSNRRSLSNGTSLRVAAVPAARLGRDARSAKPVAFLASPRTSSTKVLHSPHPGHRPSHLASVLPQFEHT